MNDERYKQIMTNFGMPNSLALLAMLQRVVNEATQDAQKQRHDEVVACITAAKRELALSTASQNGRVLNAFNLLSEAIAKAGGEV